MNHTLHHGTKIVCAATLALAPLGLCPVAASAATAERSAESEHALGGWNEEIGSWGESNDVSDPTARVSAPNHRGISEQRVFNGTTHKRAHGWTTWPGVWHYTTAQLEHYWPASGVISTSGRIWGNGGTEAYTAWVPYNPNAASSGWGTAKTYYGK